MALCAWIVPTVILSYGLLTFTDPHASVLTTDPWSRFSYFFDLRGSDLARVRAQITLVAPFYSGVAYSIGALTAKTKVLRRIVEYLAREPQPEIIGPEEAGAIVIADASIEHPASSEEPHPLRQ